MIFRPHAQVEALIDPSSRDDFRDHLEKIPPKVILYDVYGVKESQEIKIGELQTESEMVSSEYGDKTLYFQHKR